MPETPSPAPAGAAGRPRDLMVIGAVHLPASWGDSPFGRFRIATDSGDWPATEAPGSEAAFCTAQNMSLPRELFLRLGGFDVELISSEDQDLGWRVIEAGGQVAFCRAAAAEHHDGARDIRSYCRRVEWGTVWQVPYARKRPLLESSRKRAAVNGPPRPGREPWKRSALKALKSLLGVRPLRELLFALVWLLEHCRAPQGLLHRLYYLLVGIHLQRGWRQGLARWGPLA